MFFCIFSVNFKTLTMKYLYYFAMLFGVGIMVYFYGINFDNMSEEMLVNSVLYWYVPLTFGLYGIAAFKVKKLAETQQGNAVQLMFSGKNIGLTILGLFIVLYTGIIGVFLFIVPLLTVKIKSKAYDFFVALIGATIWLLGLWAFFFFLWELL